MIRRSHLQSHTLYRCTVKRMLHCLVWIIVVSGIAYRISDWVIRYRAFSSTLFTVGGVEEPASFPELTFCNLNPTRGTALFNMVNGSGLYDTLIEKLVNNRRRLRNLPESQLISARVIKNTGHRIEEMLKSCNAGGRQCTISDFKKRITSNGLCYSLSLNSSVQLVHLILDPQDYDYLIPNEGYVGFRVLVHDPAGPQDKAAQSMSNSILLGPKFQTVVRISGRKNKNCQNSDNIECLRKCTNKGVSCNCPEEDTALTNPESSNCQPRTTYHVVSVTQALKSAFFARLLAVRNPDSYNRNSANVRRGVQIQQRAFLREANRTAFNSLQHLAITLGSLQDDIDSVNRLLVRINSTLSKNLRRILHLTRNKEQCLQSISIYFLELQQMIDEYEKQRKKSPVFVVTEDSDDDDKSGNNISFGSASLARLRQKQTNNVNEELDNLDSYQTVGKKKRSRGGSGSRKYQSKVYSLNSLTPESLQLYLVNLFFLGKTFEAPVRELLRNQLRQLTSIRMKIRPTDDKVGGRSLALRPLADEICADSQVHTMSVYYYDQLERLGQGVTRSVHKLDAFTRNLARLVDGNTPVRNAFPSPKGRLWRVPHSSLVTVTIQMVQNALQPTQLISVRSFFNPVGDILGIICGTLGLAIPLMLFIELCAKKCLCCPSRHSSYGGKEFSALKKKKVIGKNNNPEMFETLTVL